MVTRREGLAAWSCGVFSLRSDISLQTSLQRGLQWSLQLNPVFYILDRLPRPALGLEKDLGIEYETSHR